MGALIVNRPRRAVAVFGTIFLALFWAALLRTAFRAVEVVRETRARVEASR